MNEVSWMQRYGHWMRDAAGGGAFYLLNTKLGDICLPGTHDSATAVLQRHLTRERDDQPGSKEAGMDWASWVWPVALGEARATSLTISQQLQAGVRAFDFRVWPDRVDPLIPTFMGMKDMINAARQKQNAPPIGDFYSVHQFAGLPYSDIVESLLTFLRGAPGEIIYARFRFYEKPDRTDRLVTEDDVCKFLQWITGKLAPFAIRSSEGNPFDKTYASLVGLDKSSSAQPAAKIIIHFVDEPIARLNLAKIDAETRSRFFTTKDLQIGLDTAGGGGGETTQEKVQNQREKLEQSKRAGPYFCLWFVKSPPPDGCKLEIEKAAFTFGASGDKEYLRHVAKGMNEHPEHLCAAMDNFKREQGICAVFVDWIEDLGNPWIWQLIRRATGQPMEPSGTWRR